MQFISNIFKDRYFKEFVCQVAILLLRDYYIIVEFINILYLAQ